jgi:hypothetical protein
MLYYKNEMLKENHLKKIAVKLVPIIGLTKPFEPCQHDKICEKEYKIKIIGKLFVFLCNQMM